MLCEKFGVGFRCLSPDDLAAIWLRALSEKSFSDDIEEKAKVLLSSERGATQKTVKALLALIPGA
jgi:hypothetical protein